MIGGEGRTAVELGEMGTIAGGHDPPDPIDEKFRALRIGHAGIGDEHVEVGRERPARVPLGVDEVRGEAVAKRGHLRHCRLDRLVGGSSDVWLRTNTKAQAVLWRTSVVGATTAPEGRAREASVTVGYEPLYEPDR